MKDNILRVKRRRPKLPRGSQLLITPANPIKKVSAINFSFTVLRIFGIFWIVVLASAVLYVLYLFTRNTQLVSELTLKTDQNAEMSAQLEKLGAEYTLLEERYNLISDTLYVKTQNEAARQEIEEGKRKPTGFPINSSATTEAVDLGAEGQPAMPAILFDAAAGSFVIASGDGIVTEVAADPEYGNIIKIDHENGYMSIYRYNAAPQPQVSIGSQISSGMPLFEIKDGAGKLAYHIIENDIYIDPMSFMEASG